MELAELGASIRAMRTDRSLTLEGLAELSGVSRAMLSDIERGAKSPTIRVLAGIASALECPISQMLGEQPPGPQTPSYNLVRRKERTVTIEPRTDVEHHLLAPSFVRRGIEILWYAIPPNSRTSLTPQPPGTEVHLTIARGELQCYVGDQKLNLEEGDSVQFQGSQECALVNPEKKPARIFLVIDTNRKK